MASKADEDYTVSDFQITTETDLGCDNCGNEDDDMIFFHLSMDGVAWHYCRGCVEHVIRVIAEFDMDDDERKEREKHIENHPHLYESNLHDAWDMVEFNRELFKIFDIC